MIQQFIDFLNKNKIDYEDSGVAPYTYEHKERGSLRIKGNLKLTGWDQPGVFPARIVVRGNLEMDDCKVVPKNVTVRGDVFIKNCSTIPECKVMEGDCVIESCNEIVVLPRISVIGKEHRLEVYGCPRLINVENCKVEGGDIFIEKCPRFAKVNRIVNGNLFVRRCEIFTQLPFRVEVNGSVEIYNCPSFIKTNENGTIKGNLKINNCKSFNGLSGGLEVHGNVNLENCEEFKDLSSGFKVHGNLCLTKCNKLKYCLLQSDIDVDGQIIHDQQIISQEDVYKHKMYFDIKNFLYKVTHVHTLIYFGNKESKESYQEQLKVIKALLDDENTPDNNKRARSNAKVSARLKNLHI